MELTGFDYVIVAIFFLSVLFGLLRGFISELISLLTWIVAFVVATLYSSKVATLFMNSSMFKSATSTAANTNAHQSADVSLFAVGVSFVCLFVLVLIIGGIINFIVSRASAVGGPGIVNRILGGMFGFIRGYLTALLVVFLVSFTAFTAQPAWKNSKYVPYFLPIAKRLSEQVMPGFEKIKQQIQTSSDDDESF